MVGAEELAFSIKDAEGDQPEKLVFKNVPELEIPITSFEDKGDFYYVYLEYDKDSENGNREYSNLVLPKDVNISYGSFFFIGSGVFDSETNNGVNGYRFSPNFQYDPSKKIDVATFENDMTFKGNSILGITSIYGNSKEDYAILNGDANLTLSKDGSINAKIEFDDFYTINFNNNSDDNFITLTDKNKISDNIKKVIGEIEFDDSGEAKMDKLRYDSYVILGSDNKIPEEILGTYGFSWGNEEKGYYATGSYGVKKQ